MPLSSLSSSSGRRIEQNASSTKQGLSAVQAVTLILFVQLALAPFSYRPEFEFKIDANANANANGPPSLQAYSALSVPKGGTINLPSDRLAESGEKERHDAFWGGKGDQKHLGGFIEIDMNSISPSVWKHVASNWTVKSVIDVGCGRGISTTWFLTHGLRTECVEGSRNALERTMVPEKHKSILTEHDFSLGPWWPSTTFDMVWSFEFLEHVNLQFQYNYISTFRKAAILVVSSSHTGGFHHVEVHSDKWWIRKYESYGFRYDDDLTRELKSVALAETNRKETFPPVGKPFDARYIKRSLKVFINPAVAGLPEHAHLFGEFGCYGSSTAVNRECGKAAVPEDRRKADKETPLDPAFYPLVLTEQQDKDWTDIVTANLQ